MKRFIAALFAVALIISPIGSYVFPDDLTTVEAKRYMSGKKSFNMPKNRPNQSNFQKKQNQQPSKHNATTKQQNSKGGFMKGLMFGGLAGLLFGGMLANMGMLGSLLGLLINIGALYLLFVIIRNIFRLFTERRDREDANPWGS
ncbi:MAG TPA: hypothetical protein VK119_05870 [Bacillota bacterium]|nr:hypothetical protein [Bacillota bacterium]